MTQQETTDDVSVEFAPIRGFKATEIPPDAPKGQWVGAFQVVKKSLTKDKGDGMRFPMLTLGITLESAEEPENESYAGVRLNDWLIFYPNGHKNQKRAKERIAAVGEALGFDPDAVIPADITSFDDLQPLVDAIDGQKAAVWTYLRNQDGENVTQIAYSAPRRR